MNIFLRRWGGEYNFKIFLQYVAAKTVFKKILSLFADFYTQVATTHLDLLIQGL